MITFVEKQDSGKGDETSAELTFKLGGTASQAEALAAAYARAPATHNNGVTTLVLQTVSIAPEVVDTTTGRGLWTVTAKYGTMVPADITGASALNRSFSFDTGGATQKALVSRKNVVREATPGGDGRDFFQAINVTGGDDNAKAEGVDIIIPEFKFSVKRTWPAAMVTAAYVSTLYRLTGKVNSTPFQITVDGRTYAFAAGEVRFDGASGDIASGAATVEISYAFAASPNVDDACASWPPAIKPAVAVPKKGHEYFWARYEQTKDVGACKYVGRPVGVYVEEVYEPADLAALGLR